MKDLLFDTEEKRKEAAVLFTELLIHPGWTLFTKICDLNIENVKALLEDTESDHTEDGDNRLRDKLKLYRSLRNTPNNMIESFKGGTEGVDPGLDPYYPSKVVDNKKNTV